jgi:biopolymer transport protein ExbB
MDVQDRLIGLASYGASWVMWLLIGLSVVGLAIALERAFVLLRGREDLDRLSREILSLFRSGDVEGARRRAQQSRSYEGRIVADAIGATEGGVRLVEERLAAATERTRLSMERGLGFLGTLGSNAPFVGLLGTVIGIVRAFHELEAGRGTVTAGLMTEIGEALAVTGIGLVVALPAVAAFNLLSRVIRSRMSRARALGRDLVAAVVERQTLGVTPAE